MNVEIKSFEELVNVKGVEYYIKGRYWEKFVDTSFSHAFGIERRGHYEVEDIQIEEVFIDGEEIIFPSEALMIELEERLTTILQRS